jgi:hypothetical protein
MCVGALGHSHVGNQVSQYSIADGGVAKYKAYIDAIREILVEYSDIQTILVVAPSMRHVRWRTWTQPCW